MDDYLPPALLAFFFLATFHGLELSPTNRSQLSTLHPWKDTNAFQRTQKIDRGHPGNFKKEAKVIGGGETKFLEYLVKYGFLSAKYLMHPSVV